MSNVTGQHCVLRTSLYLLGLFSCGVDSGETMDPNKPVEERAPEDSGSAADGASSMEDSAESSVRDTGHAVSWSDLAAAIDDSRLVNVTVMIGNGDGTLFSHSKGDTSEADTLLLASASKWLASITILKLVEEGVLQLDDHPQDHLPWWTSDPADPRSRITLEQLLSFTSGFGGRVGDVPCVEDESTTIDACAQNIYNDFFVYEPGTAFFYGPSHMQIAGAMATAATGQTFNRLFRTRIGNPLALNILSGFGLPSLDNPRVGGGATASTADYAAVLTALATGSLLSPSSTEQLGTNQTADGVTTAWTPEEVQMGELPWHYALGCWLECDENTATEPCGEQAVLSSPGAFGFYPWWDRQSGLWGIVGTQLMVDSGGAHITIPLGQEWFAMAKVAAFESHSP